MWRSVSANHEINVEGQVRNKTSGRILKPYLCGKYHGIRFEMNGKKHYIHHLVAEAFLPNPTDDECVVDHIDRDKLNNRASNLRWVSRRVNGMNRNIEVVSRPNSKSPHHHITKDKWDRFIVQIVINGKMNYGYFKTIEEAIKYRDDTIECTTSSKPKVTTGIT